MRVPQSKVRVKLQGRYLDPGTLASDEVWSLVSRARPGRSSSTIHALPVLTSRKRMLGYRAGTQLGNPQIIHTHPRRKGWRPCLCHHTCWIINILWTQAALSARETTAWFGARARWQSSASFTGFLLPSVHSSSKFSSCSVFAHSSGFFPGYRKGGSATVLIKAHPLACGGPGPSGQQGLQ